MSLLKGFIGALALAGAFTLSSCGGGGSDGAQDRQAGVAVGEPNGGVPVAADFIAKVQDAACADQRNRLFVIDKKMVFWDRAGNCADNSYSRSLFGATPQALLCSVSDSIAGPQSSCTDAATRVLFDTIVANRDKTDLGLGSSHTVEPLAVPPKAGAALAFTSLDLTTRSAIGQAQTVTIRDADSFSALWAAHGNVNQAMPLIDFSRNMVVGVFMGAQPNGCYSTGIDSVVRVANTIRVQFTDAAPGPSVMCTLAMTTPAHLIVADRSELPVEFVVHKQTVS